MRWNEERRLRIEAWLLGGFMLMAAAPALLWLFE